MRAKKILFVLLVFVAAVLLASCSIFSAEDRAEVLTQQSCLRGCIDRCPPEMARYEACATNCGTICKVAGARSKPVDRTEPPASTSGGILPEFSLSVSCPITSHNHPQNKKTTPK